MENLKLIILGYQLVTNSEIKEKMYQSKEIYDILELIRMGKPENEWPKPYVVTKLNAINSYQKFIDDGRDINDALNEFKKQYFKSLGLENCTIDRFDDERLLVKKDTHIMSTGIEFFDLYLNGGFIKQTLTGIQALTGGGKTTMLLTLGTQMLKRKYNVAFVNLEMNNDEFNYNILSGISDKYAYSYIFNFYNTENPDFVNDIMNEVKSIDLGRHSILFNDEYQKLDINRLEEILLAKEELMGIKFDFVMIDYLYLLQASDSGFKNEQNYDYQQRLTQETHKMAQRNNWAVISVFQANRGGAQNGVSGTSMAGAFNSKFDIDNYFFFERDKENDIIKITADKHRQYSGSETKQGFMKFNQSKKIYEEYDQSNIVKTIEDYSWQEIYDLPEVHENLTRDDFNELLILLGKKAVTINHISKYVNNKSDYKGSCCSYKSKKTTQEVKDLIIQKIPQKKDGKYYAGFDFTDEINATNDLFSY